MTYLTELEELQINCTFWFLVVLILSLVLAVKFEYSSQVSTPGHLSHKKKEENPNGKTRIFVVTYINRCP